MKMRGWMVLMVVLGLGSTVVAAQEAVVPNPLRVYLDCQDTRCDFDFLRRELGWVDWVRDRADAQVHLLVTRQSTGSGGREYTLRMIGLGDFENRNHDISTATPSQATDDDERRALADAMKLGLTSYAGSLLIGKRLTVRFDPPIAGTPEREVIDPWNFWVFRAGVSGFVAGESRSSSSRLDGSARATRTTDDWKIRLVASGSRSENDYVLSDSSTLNTVLTKSELNGLVVRSLGDHWSLGVQGGYKADDRDNVDRLFQVAPGIEYNIWPYSESSRRQLTVLYEISLLSAKYIDTTIYDLLEETVGRQRLRVALVQREPWGTSRLSLEGGNYLDDFSQNRLSLNGGLEFRVTKGLSVDLSGGYSRIRDQRYLPKEGATDEEVLLRLKSLQTSYQYHMSIGLSYTFGSIYNNVVNPRFGGGGGDH
ncbi:MAG: DUF481 domain-containing protein [Gemmatimonadales bacterium]|nr:MAG: DUF481 domain-containing protein [Gemmatimonadales bacterium]